MTADRRAWFPRNILSSIPRHSLSAKSRQALRLLLGVLRPHGRMLLAGLAVTVATGLCEAGTTTTLPVALQLIMNREESAWLGSVTPWLGMVLRRPADRQDGFFALLGLTAVLLLLRSAGLVWFGGGGARGRAGVGMALRRAGFRSGMGMRFGPLARHKSGDLLTHFQQASVAGEVCFQVNDLCAQAFLALAMLGVLFSISWSMTLLAVVSLLTLVWPLHLVMAIIRRTA